MSINKQPSTAKQICKEPIHIKALRLLLRNSDKDISVYSKIIARILKIICSINILRKQQADKNLKLASLKRKNILMPAHRGRIRFLIYSPPAIFKPVIDILKSTKKEPIKNDMAKIDLILG